MDESDWSVETVALGQPHTFPIGIEPVESRLDDRVAAIAPRPVVVGALVVDVTGKGSGAGRK